MSISDNLNQIFSKNPTLKDIVNKLNEANIHYGLYAGAYVSLITANRIPTDIDILVADEDFSKLSSVFPDEEVKEKEFGKYFYLNNYNIELASFGLPCRGNSQYLYRFTESAWEHTTLISGQDFKIRLCNPVDTIILKAILQRGPEVNKNDFGDVESLIKYVEIDQEYLKIRLRECQADERVKGFLRDLNILKED